MGDEIVTFSETGTSGVYAFEIDNIYAYEYAKEITVQFYEGESAVGKTLHYSVNTYLSAKQNSDYKELLKAIHNYGDAADAYVDSLELRVLITSDIHLTESIKWQRNTICPFCTPAIPAAASVWRPRASGWIPGCA